MSGATWKEYLKNVFKDYDSVDQVNLDNLVGNLRMRDSSGLENLDASLAKLETDEMKKQVVQLLWDLAHLDGRSPEEHRKVYAKLAQHYDKLFQWEDVSSPGWFIIPGPFFP